MRRSIASVPWDWTGFTIAWFLLVGCRCMGWPKLTCPIEQGSSYLVTGRLQQTETGIEMSHDSIELVPEPGRGDQAP